MASKNLASRLVFMADNVIKGQNIFGLLAVIFVLALCLGLFFLVEDGLYVTDEAVYFLTAKSFAEGSSFEIWNGLNESNSSALKFIDLLAISNGRLYEQYPPLYAIVSYPFYRFFGFHGLFLLNLVSFALSMIIIYKIVIRIFNDSTLAFASVVVYSIFTFALEFSIELWPHMLSVFLVLLSFLFVLNSNRNVFHLFAAGFISGVAVGVRYQDVLFSVVLILYLLHVFELKRFVSFLFGLSIPLSVILFINYSTVHSVSGYSQMGGFFGEYGFFQLFFLIALSLFLYFVYPKFKERFGINKVFWVYLSMVIFVFLMFHIIWPDWLARISTSLHVLYAEVFDIGSFPSVAVGDGKKALLQSTPFLVLSFFAVWSVFKTRDKNVFLQLFVCFSLVEIVFFSSVVNQHGEYTSNMRFFLESMPFLTVLSLYAVRDLFGRLWRNKFLFFTLFLLFVITNVHEVSMIFYRVFPLFLVLALITTHFLKRKANVFLQLHVCFIMVAFSYSFFISVVELGVSKTSREFFNHQSSVLCKNVAGDSLILYGDGAGIVPLAPIRLCGNQRFAFTPLSKTDEAFKLTEFYTKLQVPVYILDSGDNVNWSLFAESMRSRFSYNLTIESDMVITELHS